MMNFKPDIREFTKFVILSFCFGIIYFFAAKFSLLISKDFTYTSAFYAPTGIAIGIVILFGLRHLPVIMLAKLIVGLSIEYTMGRALISCLASGLEAYIAYYLYQSFKNSIEEYFEYQSKLVTILFIGSVAPFFYSELLSLYIQKGPESRCYRHP